jgi:hypothetical protein
VSVLHSIQGKTLCRVNENSETSAHRGITPVRGEVTGFRACKPNAGRHRTDAFSGLHLVPVKNAVGL